MTLAFAAGRVAGRSGCNRYTAEAEPGAQPGVFTIGAIAGTRMACPAPAMAVESRFLAALAAAERWAIVVSGDLAVVYRTDDRTPATLLFSEARTHRSD